MDKVLAASEVGDANKPRERGRRTSAVGFEMSASPQQKGSMFGALKAMRKAPTGAVGLASLNRWRQVLRRPSASAPVNTPRQHAPPTRPW